MTKSRNGKRAASVHPQNTLSINPALLWLASLTPAGRRGMQSLLRRCAGILRPGAKPDTYPWHTLGYTSVMRV
ncbi:site-specific integrase, partial [Escherichia coli]|nr:site-specific integrase [Escherichia coli]